MIYIFKTSVNTEKEINVVSSFLNNLLDINLWSFDLEDCDSVLRIESKSNIKDKVMAGLNDRDFECEELTW